MAKSKDGTMIRKQVKPDAIVRVIYRWDILEGKWRMFDEATGVEIYEGN